MASPTPRKPDAAPQSKVPLPARSTPGVRGTPPLPTGQLMQKTAAGVVPIKLTDLEKKMLAEAGIDYRPGMRLPANMARIIHQAREQLKRVLQSAHDDATVNLPLPVDPSTPPLEVNTIPIEQLPPDRRDYYTGVVKDLMTQELAREDANKARQDEMARLARLPQSVQQAAQQAQRATPAAQRPSPTAAAPVAPTAAAPPLQAPRSRLVTKQDMRIEPPEVVDDLDLYERVAPYLAPLPEARVSPAPAEAAAPEVVEETPPPPVQDETGGDQTMTHCPHCNFPLDQEDIPEPDNVDKMAFLHSVLGQKPFEKTYYILGGHVEITFRTLTTQEMDDVFKQAYAERNSGMVPTMADFWERVNRMRLCLQLLTFKSRTFEHNLPDGLSVTTNPNASKCWADTSAVPDKLEPGASLLPEVEAWVFAEVLRTEHLTRIVTFACNQFNRLVAKLEALVDNSDFWRGTGAQL